jgi:hypothetical protein
VSIEPRIEWLESADVAELQAFAKEQMRPGHIFARDAEVVRWQYRCPDDPERLSMLVARDRDRIVGVLGLIVVPFGVHGRKVPGGWLATWWVAPAARMRQVGLRLLRRALEEPFGFVGTTGANDTALRICRALGFSVRESIPRWVRVVSDEALERLLAGCSSGYGRPSSPASRADATSAGAPNGGAGAPNGGALSVETWSEEHAGRWNELWEERLAPELIGPWRDAEYVRWRYVEHPHFSYAVRVALGADGALRGLAAHRVIDVTGAQGRVMRMVELHGDVEAMSALACDAVASAERADVAYAEFFCSAAAVAESLRACGFTREAKPTHALPSLVEPLNVELPAALTGAFRAGPELGDGSAVFQSDALYITRADCDQDRPQ